MPPENFRQPPATPSASTVNSRIAVSMNSLRKRKLRYLSEEAALRPLLDICDALPNVRVLGLMFIAPDYEDREQCRPLFRRMHEIFLAAKDIPWKTSNIKYLSMGMSHDYEIAIEEGANIVRVGTAIFGPRQY